MRFEPPLSRNVVSFLAVAVHFRHPHIGVRTCCVFFYCFRFTFLPSAALPTGAGTNAQTPRLRVRYQGRILFFRWRARPFAVENHHKAAAGTLHRNPCGKTYGVRDQRAIPSIKNHGFYIMRWTPSPSVSAVPILVWDVFFLLIVLNL